VNSRELKLVNGCPKWCTEDHTVQAGEDREHHNGTVRELRLPDGRLVLEASLTLEPDAPTPQLVVCGSIASFIDDVQLLDAAATKAFDEELQRFSSHVTRMAATVRAAEAQVPKPKRCKPGSMKRAAWRETRLYLAERDGQRCFYCRTEFDKLRDVTIDHWVPKSMWACNLPANLRLACRPCNMRKGDRLPWSVAAVLLAWKVREGGSAADGNGAPEDVQAPPARASLASLAG
jgi:hypothetical protein